METSKIRIDTKVFVKNLTDTLQDVKDSELMLIEQERVFAELEGVEEGMKKLKEDLLNIEFSKDIC